MPPAPIRIALVGVGKIVRDQHAPVIAAHPADFALVATASPNSGLDGVPGFASIEELLAKGPAVDAVAVTSPTGTHHGITRAALLAGKHVLLEKPPCTTVTQLDDLRAVAEAAKGVTFYTSWHSRHAPRVEDARAFLAAHPPTAMEVEWREDVNTWHPGQDWIWEPGNLGVFDPGINALSILTRIAPWPVALDGAELLVPAGRQNPIAATLTLRGAGGAVPVAATLDWRATGGETWEIRAETPAGRMRLSAGGARLEAPGAAADGADDPHAEYTGLYRHFAELVRAGRSDVDDRPLRLVADAFLAGRRTETAAFVPRAAAGG